MAKKAFIVATTKLEHGVLDPTNPRLALKVDGAPLVLRLEKDEELAVDPAWAHDVKGLVADGFVKLVQREVDEPAKAGKI